MIALNKEDNAFYDFVYLIEKTTIQLNNAAKRNPEYFRSQTGRKLEHVVFDYLQDTNKTNKLGFNIELISGQKFPDIIVGSKYGIEVKSTTADHWTTTGNSVLESTRVENIDKIFIIFGKLSNEVEFISRPYEECLSEVVVTHSPRYRIDMKLAENQTFFDKVDLTYDSLASSDDPIKPIIDYYRENLEPGESLWWVNNDPEATSVPAKIRQFCNLSPTEKHRIKNYALAHFPEIFGASNRTKYDQLILWLITSHSVVSSSMRDLFTAGGRYDQVIKGENFTRIPRVFWNVTHEFNKIKREITNATFEELRGHWGINVDPDDRVCMWINLVCAHNKSYPEVRNLLLRTAGKYKS